MDNDKLERLREHAQEMGYEILEEETIAMRNAFLDDTITLRLPRELKNQIKQKAAELNIPYQRYIRSVLIEATKKVS